MGKQGPAAAAVPAWPDEARFPWDGRLPPHAGARHRGNTLTPTPCEKQHGPGPKTPTCPGAPRGPRRSSRCSCSELAAVRHGAAAQPGTAPRGAAPRSPLRQGQAGPRVPLAPPALPWAGARGGQRGAGAVGSAGPPCSGRPGGGLGAGTRARAVVLERSAAAERRVGSLHNSASPHYACSFPARAAPRFHEQ